MKYQNRHCRKRCNKKPGIGTSNVTNRRMSKLNGKLQIIYDRRHQIYRLVIKQADPEEYVFYSIVNTDVAMEIGIAVSMIARSIIALYNKLAANRSKMIFIEQWQKSGENIIVLQGYDHRHLKYLERETKFLALDKHAIYQRSHHSRLMLVLSIFGRKGDIEDVFEGLSYLR